MRSTVHCTLLCVGFAALIIPWQLSPKPGPPGLSCGIVHWNDRWLTSLTQSVSAPAPLCPQTPPHSPTTGLTLTWESHIPKGNLNAASPHKTMLCRLDKWSHILEKPQAPSSGESWGCCTPIFSLKKENKITYM